jgi:outer membrane receptor protein involved in Fe transport
MFRILDFSCRQSQPYCSYYVNNKAGEFCMKKSRFMIAGSLVGIAIFLTSPATAQQSASAPEEQTADQLEAEGVILVTGSRIKRPEYDGTIPGSSVNREQLETRAFTNTIEALNDLPLVGPGASSLGTNGGQPASLGANFVDILDLGTQRTLTLVNGRRFVSGNAGSLFVAGNATGGQVDINSIPTTLLESLDTLTVGGAVAYGSDAIAGVVNAILKTDYEGVQFGGLTSISARGDSLTYRLSVTAGTNFAEDRGNIAFSYEYNRDDGLQGDRRSFIRYNAIAPTFFGNGGRRNTAFTPTIDINVTGTNNGAFLRASDDGVPSNVILPGFSGGSILLSNSGVIFQAIGAPTAAANQIATANPTLTAPRPVPFLTQAGNIQLVPGTPIAAAAAGCSNALLATTFCRFAPSSLPGANAAAQLPFAQAVITRFAPTLSGQGTTAQQITLATNLLQANLPTPREYLQQNPNTDINAFLGTFIPSFLDVANTNATVAPFLGRTAVPLRFDEAGNVTTFVPARLDATTPSTTGGAVGGDFFNPAANTVLRAQQDRQIANLFAHYDITDSLTFYTENQYSKVESVALRNVGSGNLITSGTTENAALLLNINNPYLDAADRAALTAAGVTGNFYLSRTNQDIVGNNAASVATETYRSVIGLKGDFEALGREQNFDVSFTYGRGELFGRRPQIKDIEYALAIDAVFDPAQNRIVCRSQLVGATATPPGVAATELVRTPGPDGLITEQIISRLPTQAQINACQPLNPFGYAQQSQASRDYVIADTTLSNLSEQYFGQAILSGSLFDLPGGKLGYALVGEYRRETLDYSVDQLSQFGGTRTAALANTKGYIEAWEFAAEARIPVFGSDFNIPLFRNLDINPGIRLVRQTGAAPDVRLLNNSILEQKQPGKWNTIWSVAGTWRPFDDITFRGNITRSIKQPSIVELFLGGQPAFSGVVDPCSTANITGGLRPTVRRANCEAAVIASGLATDQTGAAAFLNSYVPSGTNINGTFAGSPGLNPERGKSWTVGVVFEPSFIPKLKFSADYINVKVLDQIIPTALGTALQVCFDSPAFPNTATEVGVNVCDFFSRINSGLPRQFEVDNGFNSGFINLGALQVKGLNITAEYEFDLDGLFGENAGSLELYTNAYHLIDYLNATDGDLKNNAQQTAGTFLRPKWEVQGRIRYENDGFYTQWTTNWQQKTKLFNAGVPATIELQDALNFPAYATHDAVVGYTFGEDDKYNFQLTMRNVFDTNYAGPFQVGNSIDLIGRRFTLSGRVKF